MSAVGTHSPRRVVHSSLPRLALPLRSPSRPSRRAALEVPEAAQSGRLTPGGGGGVGPSVSRRQRRRRCCWFLVACAAARRRVDGGRRGHLSRQSAGWFGHAAALVARPAAERRRNAAAARLGGLLAGAVELSRPRGPCRYGRRVPDVLVLVVVVACGRRGAVHQLSRAAHGVVVVAGVDGATPRRRLESDVARVHARHSHVVRRVGRVQRLAVTRLSGLVQRMPAEASSPANSNDNRR